MTRPEELRTRGVGCPRCAGSLGPGADLEQLRCGYCGFTFLHQADRDVAAFTPLGRLGRRRAHAALRQALKAQGVRGHAIRSSQLVYLPFWDLEAKLVGWQRYRKRVSDKLGRAHGVEIVASARVELEEEAFGRDVVRSLPGCDVRSFGLLGVADRVRSFKLRPFSFDALKHDEIACTVMRSRRSVLREALLYHSARLLPRGAQRPRQRFSLIRPRLRIIYYPVWRVVYVAGGLTHEASVDGIRGTVLRGSCPQVERDSLIGWVIVAAAAGFAAAYSLFFYAFALLGWVGGKMMRDGVRGRAGEIATWFNHQIGGSRTEVREIRN